ncbi:MAG: DegT/DnrJ/EryC1/StrS family aminotransferase [Gemmatimonadales bacterium]|nr:DegT/DnrJ/EryC1/StrS family aminotransferase [Gemmatimonadales bacterium]
MDFRIPLFDLNFGVEEEAAVLAALRSKWISMGPNVRELESEFAARLGVDYAIGLTNCTAALHLALKALDVGPGDEVIVPSLSFVATVNAVRYVGADPVFADVKSLEDLSLDPEDVERRITNRTKVILPMHFGGFAADMDPLMSLAQERKLAVVEDAAHAPASKYGDQSLGAIGDIGCFSFFSNKNITCGEGGLLTTDNKELATRVKLLRSHGMTTMSFERAKGHATSYDVLELGYNYRLDDVRGSLILAQLGKLDEDVARRSELRRLYEEGLSGVGEISVPYRNFPHQSSNYIMPVVLREGGSERREGVRRAMAAKGIQTSVHYPAIHRFSIYERFGTALPVTEHIADHELTLPMYAALTGSQVREVCAVLKECV